MTDTSSPLLSLPKELRLQIWDLLLSPTVSAASWRDSRYARTAITRSCYLEDPSVIRIRCPHVFNDRWCICTTRRFYIAKPGGQLSPQVLRVCRHMYDEALPSLYRRRIFEAAIDRDYPTEYENTREKWFIMHQWAQRLGPNARLWVRAVSLPMVAARFDAAYVHSVFSSIDRMLTGLLLVEFHVQPSWSCAWLEFMFAYNVFPRTAGASHEPMEDIGSYSREKASWLPPIMVFTRPHIDIIAEVSDLEMGCLDTLKTGMERYVREELPPTRTTSVSWRINNTRSFLGEYSDFEKLLKDLVTGVISDADFILRVRQTNERQEHREA